jgi:hypothetical protein
VSARARRGRRLQRWLAASFASLLAITPFVRLSWTIDSVVAAVAVASVAAQEDDLAAGSQPLAGAEPAQPAMAGILARLSSFETSLGLPAVKSPLLRLSTPDPRPGAIRASTAFSGKSAFDRSAVGTARTPTGPPLPSISA